MAENYLKKRYYCLYSLLQNHISCLGMKSNSLLPVICSNRGPEGNSEEEKGQQITEFWQCSSLLGLRQEAEYADKVLFIAGLCSASEVAFCLRKTIYSWKLAVLACWGFRHSFLKWTVLSSREHWRHVCRRTATFLFAWFGHLVALPHTSFCSVDSLFFVQHSLPNDIIVHK